VARGFEEGERDAAVHAAAEEHGHLELPSAVQRGWLAESQHLRVGGPRRRRGRVDADDVREDERRGLVGIRDDPRVVGGESGEGRTTARRGTSPHRRLASRSPSETRPSRRNLTREAPRGSVARRRADERCRRRDDVHGVSCASTGSPRIPRPARGPTVHGGRLRVREKKPFFVVKFSSHTFTVSRRLFTLAAISAPGCRLPDPLVRQQLAQPRGLVRVLPHRGRHLLVRQQQLDLPPVLVTAVTA